jgi:hypothetical protein
MGQRRTFDSIWGGANMKLTSLLKIAAGIMALLAGEAGASTITFENSLGVDQHLITTDGFNVAISSPNYILKYGAGLTCGPPCTTNGTVDLYAFGGTVTVTAVDGSAFSLQSFDAAAMFTQRGGRTWTLAGIFAGGSTITSTFTETEAQAAAFQTFSPLGFVGLASLTFSADNNFALDNIALAASPVPGPIVGAGLPGLVMALGGLVVLSRRRRNQAAAA